MISHLMQWAFMSQITPTYFFTLQWWTSSIVDFETLCPIHWEAHVHCIPSKSLGLFLQYVSLKLHFSPGFPVYIILILSHQYISSIIFIRPPQPSHRCANLLPPHFSLVHISHSSMFPPPICFHKKIQQKYLLSRMNPFTHLMKNSGTDTQTIILMQCCSVAIIYWQFFVAQASVPTQYWDTKSQSTLKN